jgi:hypothetical protein
LPTHYFGSARARFHQKRKRATQLAAGPIPPEARLAGILAWRKKKFTKNFSNGKNGRISVRKSAKSIG